MEKRTLNDADDAGPLGQHQHHWGSVSPIWRYQAAAMMALGWRQEGSN